VSSAELGAGLVPVAFTLDQLLTVRRALAINLVKVRRRRRAGV
jgi:hypothetical protein